jgi:hypothetical protein
MMNAKRLVAVAVTVLISAAIGFGSRAPYSPPGSDTSMLRLSWRLRGEKKEECRARTPEELAALPVHMRTPEVCVGHLVSYRMTLHVDDAPPIVRTFLPAGAKGDRPIFVMFDQPLEPGEHTIGIEFTPIGEDDGDGEAGREDVDDEDDDEDDEDDDDDDEHRAPLRFNSRVRVMPGQIVLITMSEDATTLLQKS